MDPRIKRRGIKVDKPILVKMLGYVTRHLIKDRLFAPTSPRGEPMLTVGSPYYEDITDGQYLKDWLSNQLNPVGVDRRDNEQDVFGFFERREA